MTTKAELEERVAELETRVEKLEQLLGIEVKEKAPHSDSPYPPLTLKFTWEPGDTSAWATDGNDWVFRRGTEA